MKENIEIRPSVTEDVSSIKTLVDSAPDALLEVTEEEVASWVEAGHSMVAVNNSGRIIGHQGMGIWEEGLAELRSAYVHPDYRRQGLNTRMKEEMLSKAFADSPGIKMVGFTEAASKSRGILQRLGFEEVELNEAPTILFSICPATCYRKTGEECGCKIFVLNSEYEKK